jgi:UV DNA damage endonuclease
MLARLGFVAAVLSEGLATSRTCRLKNATPERLRDLARSNLAELARVVEFLGRNRILLYRISSNVIPFGSHAINPVEWWDEFDADFRQLGSRIRALRIRVSTHPGQYTVLNSPDAAVVSGAIRELAYHSRMLDALATDTTSKIVIHIGGLYSGTRAAAMDRFIGVASALPDTIRRRLVVENDDRLFNADEALETARELGVPVVFDWLHHRVNPCPRPVAEVLRDVFDTWKPQDGRPKLHLSSQATGCARGAHANFVSADDAEALLAVTPNAPFDCMLEAKQKDLALRQLRDDLARRNIFESDLAECWHPPCDSFPAAQ